MLNMRIVQILSDLYTNTGNNRSIIESAMTQYLDTGFMTPEDVQAVRDTMDRVDAIHAPVDVAAVFRELDELRAKEANQSGEGSDK